MLVIHIRINFFSKNGLKLTLEPHTSVYTTRRKPFELRHWTLVHTSFLYQLII